MQQEQILKALKVLQLRNDIEEIHTFSKNTKENSRNLFKYYYQSAMFANYLIKYQLIFPINFTKTRVTTRQQFFQIRMKQKQ